MSFMKLLLLLACVSVLWAFDYGDNVIVSHNGNDYERKVIGLPGQRILPTLDADFAYQNTWTWQFWSAETNEDTVIFCNGSHVPAMKADEVPAAQVLFSLSLSAFLAAEALPDSTYWVVVRSGADPPDSEKGQTWGKIHADSLATDTD